MYLLLHVVPELADPLLVVLLDGRQALHRVVGAAAFARLGECGDGRGEVVPAAVVELGVVDEVAEEAFLDKGLEVGPQQGLLFFLLDEFGRRVGIGRIGVGSEDGDVALGPALQMHANFI